MPQPTFLYFILMFSVHAAIKTVKASVAALLLVVAGAAVSRCLCSLCTEYCYTLVVACVLAVPAVTSDSCSYDRFTGVKTDSIIVMSLCTGCYTVVVACLVSHCTGCNSRLLLV